MRIEKLRAQDLRCFDAVDFCPGPRMNWLVGPNGAGKTTLLEAIYLLSHGHSFRSGARETLIRQGRPEFLLYAEVRRGAARNSLGMARSPEGWRLRLDGIELPTLGELLQHCAVICFEPGSQSLIAGPAETRRRFIDWGVFHVERGFVERWREYRRALRQRNSLLRSGGPPDQFALWEAEIARFAGPIAQARGDYLEALHPHLGKVAARLIPELGSPRIRYDAGWNVERPLTEVLSGQRQRDVLQGHTRAGPHRADWHLGFEKASDRAYLSRGQTKLAALCCVLAQAELFAESTGQWPILGMDELASELDAHHQQLVFDYVRQQPVQSWLTSTTTPQSPLLHDVALFHVEQGAVRAV